MTMVTLKIMMYLSQFGENVTIGSENRLFHSNLTLVTLEIRSMSEQTKS